MRRNILTRIVAGLSKFFRSLLRIRGGDLLVFVLFLVLTAFFWWSRKMGETYQSQVTCDVRLTGLGENERIVKPVTPTLRVTIQGTGAVLWKENRRTRILELPESRFQKQPSGVSVLPSSELKNLVGDLLPMSVSVLGISPDTVQFVSGLEYKRKLPVRLDGRVSNADRYIVDNVRIVPDSVLVGTVGGTMDTLTQVLTEKLSIEVDSDTSEFVLDLIQPEGAFIYENAVSLVVTASQYTEKSLDVPVYGSNVPDGVLFRAFPSKVRLTFMVPLDMFEEISPDDFRVEADCGHLTGQEDKIELAVQRSPDICRNVRLQPGMIEYILERNDDWK